MIKKIFRGGMATGLVLLLAHLLMSFLFAALAPQVMLEYQNTALFRSWDDPLMSLYFGYPFILGLGLSYAWENIKSVLTGSEGQKILKFSFSYFLMATIPGMLITYSSFQVSLLIVLSWTAFGFIDAMLAALTLSRLNK